jgi:hypothetical protein
MKKTTKANVRRAWRKRCALWNEGEKLYSEGQKLTDEARKLFSKGQRGFFRAVASCYGDVPIIWPGGGECIVDGDKYTP